jgi:hypothetical protein
MDPRCVDAHEACGPQNDQLSAAGIPMRKRIASGILHWKAVIFAGQGQIEFSGANYAPFEMTPEQPFVNYTDEIVFFTNAPSVVHSFMTKFDDLWTSTTEFANYANVTGALTRRYSKFPIDPELNFPPDESYRVRAIDAYAAEKARIDVQMFRITDESHTNAMVNAVARGVPVRLITDETEYRNPDRLWDSYNVDRMYVAGVAVRFDGHAGIDHAKGVILYGTGVSIFGSSNWTSPSSDSQREHNYFTTRPYILNWLAQQFERKWNNLTGYTETKSFAPLPPDVPAYAQPANGGTGVPTTGSALTWDAGPWAHNYDIYFGTSPNPPLVDINRHLGPSQWVGDYRSYPLPALQPGTRYYWKIVSKTMASVPTEGQVWSFMTAGTAPPQPAAPADADGDGRSDLVIFRKSTGTWFTLLSLQGFQSSQVVTWGTGNDIPLVADFDGDRVIDRAFFRPADGTWNVLQSGAGFATSFSVQWGSRGDTPLAGDVDGDGRADLVIWRPSTGTFYWLRSSTGYGTGQAVQWGNQSLGDIPMLADIDGDRKADLVIWRASTGTWYWLTSSTEYSYSAAGIRQFGNRSLGDVPLIGDIDGDSRADLLVWRAPSGTWYWLTSSGGYSPTRAGVRQWGAQHDVPVLIDADGDQVLDLTIWRPSNGYWYWLTSRSSLSYATAGSQPWGNAGLGDIPVVK